MFIHFVLAETITLGPRAARISSSALRSPPPSRGRAYKRFYSPSQPPEMVRRASGSGRSAWRATVPGSPETVPSRAVKPTSREFSVRPGAQKSPALAGGASVCYLLFTSKGACRLPSNPQRSRGTGSDISGKPPTKRRAAKLVSVSKTGHNSMKKPRLSGARFP
jgi:hypothetical protein